MCKEPCNNCSCGLNESVKTDRIRKFYRKELKRLETAKALAGTSVAARPYVEAAIKGGQ